jgi:sigma-E factor negative regulatory protein RseC
VNSNQISHIGTIKSINNQHFIVKIISQTACASCSASGACLSSDREEKEIEVQQKADYFFIGEQVLVIATSRQGYKAIFYAYLLPLILLVINLIVLLSLTKNEAIAAVSSIILLFPYYLLLFFFRNRLQDSFNFTLQKQPNISHNE